jgi:predicted alpha/beta superfamily hydrolase
MRTLLLALVVSAAAGAQTPAPRPVTIGSIDSIWSPTLKEYRRYWTYTPPSYRQTTYFQRAYPVLYLLDGDAHFHSVTGLLQILGTGVNGTYVVPEMIVIAIPNTNRTRDLTPTKSMTSPDGKAVPGFAVSGGGANFLQFVKSELIPHVDSSLRTEPYRVLVGHSFGGIAALSALYTMPDVFNAYVAIDPSLWWDNQSLLKQARDYFGKPAVAKRALYVAQANTKSVVDTSENAHFKAIGEFNQLMQTGNRSGIRYAFKYYGDDDHGSVPMIAEYDALRFIFDEYKLNPELAQKRPALIAEHYAKLSNKLGYRVVPSERMLDSWGQGWFAGDTAKAMSVLQTVIDFYPKSGHAFASLGDAYLLKRDTVRARQAFERAAALSPQDQRVRDLLVKLPEKK